MTRVGEAHASKQLRSVYYFTHADFPDRELYACKGFVHVTKEGDEASVFGQIVVQDADSDEEHEIPSTTGDENEDVARFLAQGLTVDDDNQPAPENLPPPNAQENCPVEYEPWDSIVICNRRSKSGRSAKKPFLLGEPRGSDVFAWFKFFLPWKFLSETVLVATNLVIEGKALTEGEFLRYIEITANRIRREMSTIQ